MNKQQREEREYINRKMQGLFTPHIDNNDSTHLPEGLIRKHLGTISFYDPDFYTKVALKIHRDSGVFPSIVEELAHSVNLIETMDIGSSQTSDAQFRRTVKGIIDKVLDE